MAELALIDLSKSFGDTRAVDGVTFTLAHAELLAVLGPSGCGKTTLLRLIAGFETPDRGTLRINGVPLAGVPPERRRFGFVFQSYALFPHMSVRRNIAFGARGSSRAVRRRTEDLLQMVRLDGVAHRRPSQLSAGQRQRVALARALAPEPRLLLLDEPFSALDAPLRRDLRDELKRLQTQLAVSMIHVTHDRIEALDLGDRVAVLASGRLEQIGAPTTLFREPRSVSVARAVGSGTLLSGVVRGCDGERVEVEIGEGVLAAPAETAWAVGDRVTVLIPVRAVRIDPDATFGARAPAVIAATHFEGDRVLVELSTVFGCLRGYSGDSEPRGVGTTVVAGIAAERVRLFPDGAVSGP
jgi:ABC-type Fe3+/spermidine/putrescine transport system ATPase subunit